MFLNVAPVDPQDLLATANWSILLFLILGLSAGGYLAYRMFKKDKSNISFQSLKLTEAEKELVASKKNERKTIVDLTSAAILANEEKEFRKATDVERKSIIAPHVISYLSEDPEFSKLVYGLVTNNVAVSLLERISLELKRQIANEGVPEVKETETLEEYLQRVEQTEVPKEALQNLPAPQKSEELILPSILESPTVTSVPESSAIDIQEETKAFWKSLSKEQRQSLKPLPQQKQKEKLLQYGEGKDNIENIVEMVFVLYAIDLSPL